MILLTVLVNAVQARRGMRRAKGDVVERVAPRAANSVAFKLRGTRSEMGEIQKRWNRTFKVRNKRFPSVVLRVKTATRKRPVATVRNVSRDDLLDQQIDGGVRRPKTSSRLFVPKPGIPRTAGGRVRRTVFRNVYRSGRYLFRDRKRGPDEYLGVLTPTARIDQAFPLAPLQRYARRQMRRELRRLMRREGRRSSRQGMDFVRRNR